MLQKYIAVVLTLILIANGYLAYFVFQGGIYDGVKWALKENYRAVQDDMRGRLSR
jgi:hypothetical protein